VKAYYDKKNKKTQGQITAENQPHRMDKSDAVAAAEAPKAVLKPEETAEVLAANEKKKARPN
jgi:hypothetical protein